MHYWGARYYDPKIGRGIQPDGMSVAEHVDRWKARLGTANRLPLEINPYPYALNNPLRYTDPSGFSSSDDFGDWLEKEQYIQSTLNTEGTQFLENWTDFVTTWGEVSAATVGTVGCPKPSAETVKKACVVLGFCSGTLRGEEMDDVLRDLITRENLRRASEIVQQTTKTLTK